MPSHHIKSLEQITTHVIIISSLNSKANPYYIIEVDTLTQAHTHQIESANFLTWYNLSHSTCFQKEITVFMVFKK